MSFGEDITEKVEIVGDFTVTIQEKQTEGKKIGSLVTFHDIGLNHNSFKEFFKNEYNVQFYEKFIVYHIDMPGQHKGADKFEAKYEFPSLSKIGEMIGTVFDHFKLKDVVGLGVGAGANILMSLAMLRPELVLGIVVVDAAGKSAGFKEWGEERLAAWQLENKGFNSSTNKFLIWHLFGTVSWKSTYQDYKSLFSQKGKKLVNMEMVDQYIEDVTANQNPHNLAQYVKAYMHRSDIMSDVHLLKCHVLIITSSHSPYKDEAHKFHAKMDLEKSSVLESNDTINAFFEDPGKCGEGMLLLMQGLGLVPTLRTRTASRGGPVHKTPSMCE